MTLLASIFKTSRKRSRSDAELPPDSIHAQQWGQLPLPQQAQAQDYQSQHTLPPPRPDSGPALSRMSTMSTMSSADAGLRSRGGARLSVAVSETNFDSSSTLVDPQGGFNFPAPASIPSQSTVGLPELKREQVGGTVVRACSCACACTEYELRKHRARDRAAVIRVGVRYGFMFVHTALTMASLMIALHRRDVILIGMVAGLTLAYLVYIPSAFALCLAKTASRFDHVAGEIAYLSVQIAGYLGAGLYPSITLGMTDCNAEWENNWWTESMDSKNPQNNKAFCRSLRISMGLGFGHMLILAMWLAGLIAAAVIAGKRSRGGPGIGRTLQVSTGWLLSGWPISVAEKAKPR